MSSEKRLILFTLVTFVSIVALQYAMDLAGLIPPQVVPVASTEEDAAAKAQLQAARGELVIPDNPFVEDAKPAEAEAAVKADAPEPKEPAVEKIDFDKLVLGSTARNNPYRLELVLEQKGAGVASVSSSVYDAEFETNKPRRRPLQILKYDPLTPPSLALTLVNPRDKSAEVDPDDAVAAGGGLGVAAALGGEVPLDGILWEVVRDDQDRIVRPIPAGATIREGMPPRQRPGQALVFRTRVDSLGVTLTKTFRLFEGEDGFDVDLTFESPQQTRSVVYKLLGPHGIPIEGEWYTGTFREAIFGLADGSATKIKTIPANDIAKRGPDDPERFQAQPLRFLGIENQYFASILEPDPLPTTEDDRRDAEAAPVILHVDPSAKQKADIGVELTSKPVQVGPNLGAVTHAFKVFAGPKTPEILSPYHLEDLAKYRKSSWIPYAPDLAIYVITPLLDSIYQATATVTRAFGGKGGNYGVAIILLTMLVRLAMFPLSRKQAISAKKMQELQPQLKEIQEKYKDDKERQGKETWAFYNKHGINPVKGCLPALIQLPIFVGLWQALNNSVHLRHASFLYIRDLSAPDMLFRFPSAIAPIPFLGDYFNLLPFVVVALMLVQTKLFSPPPTTPEAEAQQKMMKYMMVFMAFMFYKVPSGLGIYFITSSLWQICERLLLPKVSHVPPSASLDDGKNPPQGGDGGGGRGGNNGSSSGPAKPPGRFSQFMQKVLDEAQKNPTYRNLVEEQEKEKDKERQRTDRDRRDKGKPRARPGRKR